MINIVVSIYLIDGRRKFLFVEIVDKTTRSVKTNNKHNSMACVCLRFPRFLLVELQMKN